MHTPFNPFIYTWRWFGPKDPVDLSIARQAGATGIVTALHHLPNGSIWPIEEIRKRQAELVAHNLTWSVVESVPIHEDIKLRRGNWEKYTSNYIITLHNLAACGIATVCYNFMPVLDWTRTDLSFQLPHGGTALRFDRTDLAIFDGFLLKRPDAEADHPSDIWANAQLRVESMSDAQKDTLIKTLIAGLPGAEESYTLDTFRQHLEAYKEIQPEDLRQNMYAFLEAVVPVAQEVGIKLTIHPDDPPFSLLGLPRVVSTLPDLAALFHRIPSPSNGLCYCVGSLGARSDNDLLDIIHQFSDRIHFLHLRNVQLEPDGSFYEADHIGGSANMVAIIDALIRLTQNRNKPIPLRPDHGHRLASDLNVQTNPGYTAVGRLKGLAEIRGVAETLSWKMLNE
ncbi:MAG TPA: mannonate dehydratase [Saprospiraceae bacterium]|nr:mannonate dehydratase [Saprospiraceae bacterium]HMQ81439.1 mannonate dehydratase [Saprospiraceae bacterium]